MSIKFGLLTNPENTIFEEIKLIRKLGFDYVELGIEQPESSPQIIIRNKKKILELVGAFNSPTLAHTAWWIDFGSGYDDVNKVWLSEAKKCIDAAKTLSIKKINFHFYSVGFAYKPYHRELLENIVKNLKHVVNYANSRNMIVMLENTPNKRSLIGLKDYKFVIDNVPKLTAHLDVGHAFIENGMKGVKEYLFTFRDKLEHIHIHDNHGEGDEHLPLGKGEIDFEQVAKWLEQINYDKTMTFEVFTSKEDAKESMLKFKKML